MKALILDNLVVQVAEEEFEVAPTLNGKVNAFPSPQAKYNLGAEKNISLLVIFNTFFA